MNLGCREFGIKSSCVRSPCPNGMVNYAAHVYIEINDDFFFAQLNQGPNSSGSSAGNCVEY